MILDIVNSQRSQEYQHNLSAIYVGRNHTLTNYKDLGIIISAIGTVANDLQTRFTPNHKNKTKPIHQLLKPLCTTILLCVRPD